MNAYINTKHIWLSRMKTCIAPELEHQTLEVSSNYYHGATERGGFWEMEAECEILNRMGEQMLLGFWPNMGRRWKCAGEALAGWSVEEPLS